MAAKPTNMEVIKEVLRLHKEGRGKREIARLLGIDRNTVKKYLRKAEADRMNLNELVKLDDPVLAHRMCGGNAAYSDPRFDILSKRLDYITKELRKTGVTRHLIWQELKEEYGERNMYSYTQFCYHLKQHAEAGKPPSMVLGDTRQGGKELFVDFAGDKLSYVDPGTGEVVACEVFVACMPASDYGFALAVPSQKTEDFMYAMEKCVRSLGALPQVIVTDNLKSAVTKADRYDPDINTVMTDFANHYECVFSPARPRHPKDKALVEDHVKLTYQRVYAPLRNRQFFSLEDLNKAIAEMMRRHNQKRMQQHNFTREERYLADEKPYMRPLRPEPFEIRRTHEYTVQGNSYIYMALDRHYYSVPYRLLGKRVLVQYTKSLVEVYFQGEKVACHKRCVNTKQMYSTVEGHLPSYFNDYKELSPEKFEQKARMVSANLAIVIHNIFALHPNNPPEMFYKGCEGLLHLARKSDKAVFDKAVETAIEYNQYSYRFIKRLIDSKCAGAIARNDDVEFPGMHPNIRGIDDYASQSYTENKSITNNIFGQQ